MVNFNGSYVTYLLKLQRTCKIYSPVFVTPIALESIMRGFQINYDMNVILEW